MTDLSPQQLVTLQKLLDERAQTVEATMQDQVDRLRDITDPQLTTAVGDLVDRAEIAKEREEENAAVDRELSELREIEAARTRIANGEAGICIDCDEPIAFKRLLARPTATRCIDCQALAEQPARQAAPRAFRDGAGGGDDQSAPNYT